LISARRGTVSATSIIFLLRYIAFGAADYSPSVPEFDADKPVVRPVLGGTGKYMGARGQVTSTRSSDGSYAQVFTLLK